MKDDIRNIINLENITRVRSSISLQSKLPPKNSLVKLIPLEYLEQGVKVLINGKLFIAFIDGKIPIKEELIAEITSTNPFSLSLNLSSQLKKNENELVDEIIRKFELKNPSSYSEVIKKVIEEGNNVIKSKIVFLTELLRHIKADGLELSLLINLVWSNSFQNKDAIENLYEKLFDESFYEVCQNLFESIKGLLFAGIPQYLTQNLNNSLIYYEGSRDSKPLLNKIEQIFELVKQLNEYKNFAKIKCSQQIENFINYGAKYILQKSVLKDYDYFPDFVLVKKDAEIMMLLYSVKRIYNSNDHAIHKVSFKNENLPFKLSGVIRDNFLSGNLDIEDELIESPEITSFEENLFNNWGFRSEIKINNNEKEDFLVSKINTEVNKLVS